jgi:hypothetical protein
MMRSRVDLPEPFKPKTPILAPGKKDKEISFKIVRFGGTTLETLFIDMMNLSGNGCAIKRDSYEIFFDKIMILLDM